MERVLETKNLSKNYGRIQAVKDLSLEVGPGHVYGILGPNGSGKTTTLSIITGIIASDAGFYQWFGQEPRAEMRKNIGSLFEIPNFYPYLNLIKNLTIVARIKDKPIADIMADSVNHIDCPFTTKLKMNLDSLDYYHY